MATPATDDQQMVLLLHWWLTERREALGYSWEDLARLTGTLPQTVEQWAAGESLPDYPQLQALAQHLGDPEHPPGAEPLPDTDVTPHDFVIAGNGLGIGKCMALDNGTATVEYFDTIARRETRTVPAADLRVVRLANQTRCYVFDPDDDRWHMGRVRRLGDGDHMIELPDQEVKDPAPEHLFVRWTRPVDDPTETLKQKGHETVFFRNQREPFVRALLRQRTAAHNASGLLSSSINLYPHQVAVAQRMLEDPTPRFLLMDEPGLGSVVQAGIMLRQVLIDADDATVHIAAPTARHARWQRALNEQFDTEALPGTVDLIQLSALADASTADLLVVDAAHRLNRDHPSFDAIARRIHQTPRLLLLADADASAGPASMHPLLHLLDPDAYPLDDTDAVEQQHEQRQAIGPALQSLHEQTFKGEAEADACSNILSQLRSTVPESETGLRRAMDTLDNACSSGAGEALTEAAQSLRIHLTETYRWHPRVLHVQRADVESVDTPRSAPDYAEFGMDLREETVHERLATWRTQAAATEDDAYAPVFRTLAETASSHLPLVADVAAYRREGTAADRLSDDLTAAEMDRLSRVPLFDGEADLLADIEEAARAEVDAMDLSHADWLSAFLDQKIAPDDELPETFVVYTRYPSVATHLHEALTEQFGHAAVALHHTTTEPDLATDAIDRLVEEDACRILVCDRSALGRADLQHADHLVHYDLPWDAIEVEQRIGRLDRIGRDGRPLHTHVYLGPDVDGSLFEAWYQLLRDGIGVFDDSLAPMHSWVDAHQSDWIHALFADGPDALADLCESVRNDAGAVRTARRQQALFEQPEALHASESAYVEALNDLESDSRALYRDMDPWITKALRFHRSKRGYPDDMMRYQPDFNGKTLIPFDTILNRFLPKSDKPTTYHRSVAVASQQRPSRSANLFRIGHPFLDALVDYFQWDDRGRAYAIWRTSRQWNLLGQEDALYFRFEFVVEANTEHLTQADDAAAQAALQRRADGAFAPQFVTVCTDARGQVVDNEGVRSLLEAEPERQQDGGADTNIKGDRLPVLDDFVPPKRWATRCDDARDAARTALLRTPAVREHQQQALDQIDADRTLTPEHADQLRASIEDPAVRLDSVGAIVLSGNPIPVEEDDE